MKSLTVGPYTFGGFLGSRVCCFLAIGVNILFQNATANASSAHSDLE
jgi:hypothetical protein